MDRCLDPFSSPPVRREVIPEEGLLLYPECLESKVASPVRREVIPEEGLLQVANKDMSGFVSKSEER